jgi:2-haloacid dehalogenase
VISVDARKVFKPDPRAYELIQEHLKLPAEEAVFVSSNGFDVAGARSFGLNVVRVERATPASLRAELTSGAPVSPFAMFKALRMQEEALGYPPTEVVASLQALPAVIDRLNR